MRHLKFPCEMNTSQMTKTQKYYLQRWKQQERMAKANQMTYRPTSEHQVAEGSSVDRIEGNKPKNVEESTTIRCKTH